MIVTFAEFLRIGIPCVEEGVGVGGGGGGSFELNEPPAIVGFRWVYLLV